MSTTTTTTISRIWNKFRSGTKQFAIYIPPMHVFTSFQPGSHWYYNIEESCNMVLKRQMANRKVIWKKTVLSAASSVAISREKLSLGRNKSNIIYRFLGNLLHFAMLHSHFQTSKTIREKQIPSTVRSRHVVWYAFHVRQCEHQFCVARAPVWTTILLDLFTLLLSRWCKQARDRNYRIIIIHEQFTVKSPCSSLYYRRSQGGKDGPNLKQNSILF